MKIKTAINHSDQFLGGDFIESLYTQLPLICEQNDGQTNRQVYFLCRVHGGTIFLTANDVWITLSNATVQVASAQPESVDGFQGATLQMRLVGANSTPEISGVEELETTVNYLIGNNPQEWQTNIPTYARVKYQNIYPGVDMVYYGNQQQLEYDFIVSPGSSPDSILIEFQGADKIEMDAQGNLLLSLPGGQITQTAPRIYQEIAGEKREISGKYVLRGRAQVGFEVQDYDTSKPLVIDPVLLYSTYFGDINMDQIADVTTDSVGNVYVVGFTTSTTFPVQNAYQATFGGGSSTGDVFVSKVNADGSGLIYSTYLGGSNDDAGLNIAVDATNNVYVTGETKSINFPTLNPIQPAFAGGTGSGDAFVTKLNSNGNGLIYSTYLGGNLDDSGRGIALDTSGNVYISGATLSSNFPTMAPFQASFAGGDDHGDAFITKVNSTGTALVYSTYLGGSGSDDGLAIAVYENAGNAYAIVTGETRSVDFPLMNPFQSTPGGADDAFVTKLDYGGNVLVYSTYLGGSDNDDGLGLMVDSSGNVYISGKTISTDFPIQNAIQSSLNGLDYDAFLAKLNPTGVILVFSTYLGGTAREEGRGVDLDNDGNIYWVGTTRSTDFPIVNAIQASFGGGGYDAFVVKLNPTTPTLIYATYLGGSGQEEGFNIAEYNGNAYVVGLTLSTNFPTLYPLQPTNQGGVDGFITKISASDIIFADGFLPCDLSAWSPNVIDGGDLNANTALALVGICGMQAVIDDNVSIYVTDTTPNSETHYRARFYFDPNTIGMANGNAHYIFYGLSGTSTVVTRIELRRSGENYQLRAALRNDGSTFFATSWFTIADSPHFIEVDWQTATTVGANNGSLTFWIDGIQKANLMNVDNDTRRIDQVRLGAVAGVDSGTRGIYYFDAFESRKQTYIGP